MKFQLVARRLIIPTVLLCALVAAVSVRGAEYEAGLITFARVRGKVEVRFNKESHRAQNGTQCVAGVTIESAPGSQAVIVFANGSAALISGGSLFTVRAFRIIPFPSPNRSLYRLRQEPSISQTNIQFERGEITFFIRNLHKDSEFAVVTPFGSIWPRPDKVNYASTFLLRDSGSGRTLAVWKGSIDWKSPTRREETIEGDRHVFFNADLEPLVANGLEWTYVRLFERRMFAMEAVMKKFRLK
jgi:hypothetical protein